jgi:hypothetical protein
MLMILIILAIVIILISVTAAILNSRRNDACTPMDWGTNLENEMPTAFLYRRFFGDRSDAPCSYMEHRRRRDCPYFLKGKCNCV